PLPAGETWRLLLFSLRPWRRLYCFGPLFVSIWILFFLRNRLAFKSTGIQAATHNQSGHILAAVDLNDLAGHIAGLAIRCQVDERAHAFLRNPEPPHGNR